MPEITDEYPKEIENPIGMKVVGWTTDGRPIIENMDGSFSSSASFTYEIEPQVWMNIPTIFRGKYVVPDHAIEILKRFNWVDPDSGRDLARFTSQEAAIEAAAARAVHINEQVTLLQAGLPDPKSEIEEKTE